MIFPFPVPKLLQTPKNQEIVKRRAGKQEEKHALSPAFDTDAKDWVPLIDSTSALSLCDRQLHRL